MNHVNLEFLCAFSFFLFFFPSPIDTGFDLNTAYIDKSQDLATAFVEVLGNEKASKQVFNISGERYVTFDGLARACAKVILAVI